MLFLVAVERLLKKKIEKKHSLKECKNGINFLCNVDI